MLSIIFINAFIKPCGPKIIISHLTVARVIAITLGETRMSRTKEPVELAELVEILV